MTSEPLDATESAAWRALMVFWRQGLPQLERTFKRVGLSHLEYGFLAVLSEQPEGTMSAGDLAALAGISSSRLSHRLKQMETRGDVRRGNDPHDARMVLVSVTQQGLDKAAAVYGDHLADVRRLVFDHLDDAQTAALADAMMAVASRLSAHPFLDHS